MGNGPLTLRLTADTVHTAGTLLDCGRVPAKIIVDDVTTLPMKVDALLSNLRADEDFGEWSC